MLLSMKFGNTACEVLRNGMSVAARKSDGAQRAVGFSPPMNSFVLELPLNYVNGYVAATCQES